jgi:hypothetical protein
MKAYRIYFVGRGDQFTGFTELACASDVQAIAEAVALLNGSPGEVWQVGRKIARITGDGTVTRA